MVDIKKLIEDSYSEIEEETTIFKRFVRKKLFDLEMQILDDLESAMKIFELRVERNLRDYDASGSKKRHDTIEEAFKLAREVFGFKFNEKGSFLDSSAKKLVDEELSITGTEGRKFVKVTGRIEDMEKGKVDWKDMAGFFYGNRSKFEEHLGKEDCDAFYKRLAVLFRHNIDPTMPIGRPYATVAAQSAHRFMDESIKLRIKEMFPNGRVSV